MSKGFDNNNSKLKACFQPVSKIDDSRYFTCIAKGSGYNFLVHAIPKVKFKTLKNENDGELIWMVTTEDLIGLLKELTNTHVYEIHELGVMSEDDWNYLNKNYPIPVDSFESENNEEDKRAA